MHRSHSHIRLLPRWTWSTVVWIGQARKESSKARVHFDQSTRLAHRPPRANTVTAVVRLTKNDLTEFVEIIKITETEDALELRLRLFGSDLNLLNEEPHVFKAINQQKHSITFRGVSKSAHRTLRYELVAPGRFDISWESQEGQRTVIHLSLAKAKSKHPPQKKN
jgi:hypothetical protein